MLKLAGRKIPGMVYFGKPPNVRHPSNQTINMIYVYIDPNLEIAADVGNAKYNITSKQLNYDKWSPTDRANYLDWLATDQSDGHYNDAYTASYFLGLEWSYFQDSAINDKEKRKIKREIYRLYEIYGYLSYGKQITNAVAYFERDNINLEIFETEQVFNRADRIYNFMIEGGHKTRANDPLNASHVYTSLVATHEESIEPVREVCPYVFEKLFVEKFNQKYPNGLIIPQPKKSLPNEYNSELQYFNAVSVCKCEDQEVPNISGSPKLHQAAVEIGKLVHKELEQYAIDIDFTVDDFLHNGIYDFSSRSTFSLCRGDQILIDWIEAKLKEAEGLTLGDIAYLMNFELLENESLMQWYRIIVAFERLGYGIAPELALWMYDTNINYPIYIYKFESTPEVRAEYTINYLSVLLSMIIGFIFFESGEELDEQKLQAIASRIDANIGLNRFEFELLIANFRVMKVLPPDINYFDRIMQSNFYINPEVIRETIKAYAEVDESLLSNHLEEIKEIYALTELDYRDVETDLNLPPDAKTQFKEYDKKIRRTELALTDAIFKNIDQ